MTRFALWLVAFLLPASLAVAGEPAAPSTDAAALAARIDAHLETAWRANKITPAATATDGEFLRRVYLDLAGRIPTVAEVRAFLADKGDDKRRRLIAQLLRRPTYARHMTTVWQHMLIPEADSGSNLQFSIVAVQFAAWLREQFAKDAGYDQIVRELLTTPVDAARGPGLRMAAASQELTPVGFYAMKESKPENLAASSARVFLGIRLECAQCHDHPFATWTRDQFWGLAAFFAGLSGEGQMGDSPRMARKESPDRRELMIPGTSRLVQAAFPDGAEPQWKSKVGARQTLADWVTAKNNPYFARATVNRVWAQMFGAGLIEPVDEMAGGQDTKVQGADLLDELAKAFVAHQFDLRFLFEAIAGSKAYQRSSKGKGPAPLFSRQSLRGLSGEQLFDSLSAATGQPDAGDQLPAGRLARNNPRAEFIGKFGQPNARPTERETSIVQALTLMNGSFVSAATSRSRSELLGAVLEAPFLNETGRIETVYLATLSRLPTESELERVRTFIQLRCSEAPDTENKTDAPRIAERGAVQEGPKAARNEALADVFWALLNSAEFGFNH